MKTIYRCAKCKSEDVECTAWVGMNTDQLMGSGSEGPTGQVWCPECENDNADVEEATVKETVEDFIKTLERGALEDALLSIAHLLYYKGGEGWKIDRDGHWSSDSIQGVAERMPQGMNDVISDVEKAWGET